MSTQVDMAPGRSDPNWGSSGFRVLPFPSQVDGSRIGQPSFVRRSILRTWGVECRSESSTPGAGVLGRSCALGR
jgi:hypothetical protein